LDSRSRSAVVFLSDIRTFLTDKSVVSAAGVFKFCTPLWLVVSPVRPNQEPVLTAHVGSEACATTRTDEHKSAITAVKIVLDRMFKNLSTVCDLNDKTI
jgi:hypothetical protein